VVGCPFRVDRLAGVDTVGCDRRRLQLGHQMLQLENKYSRGAPPTLSGIGAPRRCDPARLAEAQPEPESL
jgi:hypothetical protein